MKPLALICLSPLIAANLGGCSSDAGENQPSEVMNGTGGNPISENQSGGAQASGAASSTGGSSTSTGGSPASGGADVGTGGSTGGAPAPVIEIASTRTGRKDIDFTVTAADETAMAFHGEAQRGTFDADKTVQGKLAVILGGIGSGPHTGGVYQFAAGRGFHVMAVDYFNIVGGESNQGKIYLETFSGQDLTDVADVSQTNSVMNRIKTGLTHLNAVDEGAAWDFYLNAEGEIRWEDVILFGYSYGGQTVLAATKYVAPYRALLAAAPTLPDDATWISDMPNVANVGQCYVIASNGDEEKYAKLTQAGWPGTPQLIMNDARELIISPPFNNSSMLQGPGGHTEFCSTPGYDPVCEFIFDVTP